MDRYDTVIFGVFGIYVILSIIRFLLIQSLTTKGIDVQAMQTQITTIQHENSALQEQIAICRSYQYIEGIAKKDGFHYVTDKDYLVLDGRR